MENLLTENNINIKNISSPVRDNKTKFFYNNTIIQNDLKWGDKIKNYKKLKDIFYYEPKCFPKHITTKMITDSQRQFNPITQRYYNEEKEKKNIKESRNYVVSLISKGYDKQLEVESTYDIINLKNKLGYFKYKDSLKTSDSGHNSNSYQFNYEKNNIKPYNIISNLSLRKHNYVSPELRPKNDDNLMKSNEGLIFRNNINNSLDAKMNNKYGRDFNIINNRYKVFNEDKMKTEKEIKNLIALKKLRNKNYDLIKGEYYNPEVKDNAKKVDKNYIVRNPINNMIIDVDEQRKLDEIEYNKKKRFKAGDELDNFRHSMGNNIEAKKLIDEQNYFNPFEYKILNKRGYDILTNERKTLSELNKNLSEIQSNKLVTNWDKIKNNSDENNNTFKNKKIYKAEYDESDIDINYSNYMKIRKPILNKRFNTLEAEPNNNPVKKLYLLKTPIPRKKRKEENNRSIQEIMNLNNSNSKIYNKMENRVDEGYLKYSKMNKDLFFGTPKSVLKKKPNYKI